jgi:hypothetical protein
MTRTNVGDDEATSRRWPARQAPSGTDLSRNPAGPNETYHAPEGCFAQMAGQLRDINGDRLTIQDVDWSQWETELAAVIQSVISCESFVDQRALESLRPEKGHGDPAID